MAEAGCCSSPSTMSKSTKLIMEKMNIQINQTPRRITAHQAAHYIPSFEEIVGNYKAKEFLVNCCQKTKPEDDANVLLLGPPGSCKTYIFIRYVRERLNDPTLGFEEDAGLHRVYNGKPYDFFRIMGASISEKRLQEIVGVVH